MTPEAGMELCRDATAYTHAQRRRRTGCSNTPGTDQSVRTRVVQEAARPEPRGRREANAQVHVVRASSPDGH